MSDTITVKKNTETHRYEGFLDDEQVGFADYREDGDVVTITASAPGPGGTRIGFGEVSGRVLPAR